MPKINRPSAYDISFPDENNAQPTLQAGPSRQQKAPTPLTTTASAFHAAPKRPLDDVGKRPHKRQRQFKLHSYTSPANVISEANLVLPEEDNTDLPEEPTQKPTRILTDFCFYDSRHDNELVSLSCLEEDDGQDRRIEAAGRVRADCNDEDEGQEDDDDPSQGVLVELGAVFRFGVDYTIIDVMTYQIETAAAWYILEEPSAEYRDLFSAFVKPHEFSRLCIMTAAVEQDKSFTDFFHSLKFINSPCIDPEDLSDPMLPNELLKAIEQQEDATRLKRVPFINRILGPNQTLPTRQQLSVSFRPRKLGFYLNLDTAVLRRPNRTHVTAAIAKLADGHFREQLFVVGAPSPAPDDAKEEHQRRQKLATLRRLIQRANNSDHEIDYGKLKKTQYLDKVKIHYNEKDAEIVSIGDVVVVYPAGQSVPKEPNILTPDMSIADFFWFGEVQYFDSDREEVHLYWFDHGKKILLAEFGHPQELFLQHTCDSVPVRSIVGKVKVHFMPKEPINHQEFFYKFQHDPQTGSFEKVERNRSLRPPPHNCASCLLRDKHDSEASLVCTEVDIVFKGQQYHVDDYVLYRSMNPGPAEIGQIQTITPSRGKAPAVVTVKKLGRYTLIPQKVIGTSFRNERELFFTEEMDRFNAELLCELIFVISPESFEKAPTTLETWLASSPFHYFVKTAFPSLRIKDLKDQTSITCSDVSICKQCVEPCIAEIRHDENFTQTCKKNIYHTLDLFGGVGAFGLSVAEGSGGCLKVTHAIEISPSAAETYRYNSPDTIVYNQCANTMLNYIIKRHRKMAVEKPVELLDGKTPVQEPPKENEIKAIVAGFPCQTHSGLNMFRKASDPKSNLILLALSYVDHLRPSVCYFENVPGFLRFNLNAIQRDKHTVTGGVPMGGLKLLVRALLDMNYQVRYGLLQAGHYGTPQDRIRFFLVATQPDIPLPLFPKPTHYFVSKTLRVELINGSVTSVITPVEVEKNAAPHSSVTLRDSISDLPLFDWKLVKRSKNRPRNDIEHRIRADIPAIACSKSETRWYCGQKGRAAYEHEPRTSYQARCREEETRDLQHYTRHFKDRKVEQVLAIPLKAGADYRTIPTYMGDFQFTNPMSALGRANFRRGLFERLDIDGRFSTTVTNMHPTAKQSKVLHPHCKRMVTVRELARSQGFRDNFVFRSINNDIVTMHRQIGNAVPWQVGNALGRELRKAMHKKWKGDINNAIDVDNDR